jgi:hypothetical protein
MKLEKNDLYFALKRMPKELVSLMKSDTWIGKIFVGDAIEAAKRGRLIARGYFGADK